MGCCSIICYQDIKERTVYWFMFPLLALLLGLTHYLITNNLTVFIYYTLFNILLISLIILLLYLYTKLITKKKFLNYSFGMGDLLFFYALSFGFPSVTFIILFSSAIIFSTLLFFSLKNSMIKKTAPLAGFMGLFLAFIFCYSIFNNSPSLYFY